MQENKYAPEIKNEDAHVDGSFLRESGKILVGVCKQVAEAPGASDQIKHDWRLLKEWLNYPDGEIDGTTEKKITLAWQSYLALGSAPSAALVETFIAAKETAIKEGWATTHLPERIQAIFARMLATDAEIKQRRNVLSRGSTSQAYEENITELKDVYERLRKLFIDVLRNKRLFPSIRETSDFPFPDFSSTLDAIRSGQVKLSFGPLDSFAFGMVAKDFEIIHLKAATFVPFLVAPLLLIWAAIDSGNYATLLWSTLLLPLAFFGTTAFYKKAPFFLVLAAIGFISGFGTPFAFISGFVFLAIWGYSTTRRLYEKVLLSRAFKLEIALMFLLGGNYIRLCDKDLSRLWTPKWLTER